MGRDKLFVEEVRNIMRTADGKKFRSQWKKAADKGVYMDRELMDSIHYELTRALRRAQQAAEFELPDQLEIQEKKFINDQIDRATRLNDVDEVLRLQKLQN